MQSKGVHAKTQQPGSTATTGLPPQALVYTNNDAQSRPSAAFIGALRSRHAARAAHQPAMGGACVVPAGGALCATTCCTSARNSGLSSFWSSPDTLWNCATDAARMQTTRCLMRSQCMHRCMQQCSVPSHLRLYHVGVHASQVAELQNLLQRRTHLRRLNVPALVLYNSKRRARDRERACTCDSSQPCSQPCSLLLCGPARGLALSKSTKTLSTTAASVSGLLVTLVYACSVKQQQQQYQRGGGVKQQRRRHQRAAAATQSSSRAAATATLSFLC